MDAEYYIQKLNLEPHPEGGYYNETYRSELVVTINGRNRRNVSTAIYFLLMDDQKSKFHRIQSDELWFYHVGEPIEIVLIINENLVTYLLGNNMDNNERPQVIIPANTWFAAKIASSNGFSLVSCTVAPGFDFYDFELADRSLLLNSYPQLMTLLEEFL